MTDHPERVIRYFEDYVPGLVVDCGTFSLDEGEIIAFAKEYDPQPFHVDPVAAEDGPFGGLIASGWQTTSKMMRLLVEYFVSPESGLGAVGVHGLVRLRHRGRRVLRGERGLRPRDRHQRAGDGYGRSGLPGLHRYPLHLGGGRVPAPAPDLHKAAVIKPSGHALPMFRCFARLRGR